MRSNVHHSVVYKPLNGFTLRRARNDGECRQVAQVDESRVGRWCKKVREPMLQNVRKLPTNAAMSQVKNLWYRDSGGSRHSHYDSTRYAALNLHAVFSHGTLEWRCFNSTLHAGEVRSNIVLALAISAQAINQRCAHMSKTQFVAIRLHFA